MTMRAAVINLGNCEGDELQVEHADHGKKWPNDGPVPTKETVLKRGAMVEVSIAHGREDPIPLVIRARDVRGLYVGFVNTGSLQRAQQVA